MSASEAYYYWIRFDLLFEVVWSLIPGAQRLQGGLQLDLYTILPLPILYVEWQHRGGGGKPDIAQY